MGFLFRLLSKSGRIWEQRNREILELAFSEMAELKLADEDFQAIHDRIRWPSHNSTVPARAHLAYLAECLDSDKQLQQFSPVLIALYGRWLWFTQRDGISKMSIIYACFEVREDDSANRVLAYALLTSKGPKQAARNLFKMWQQYTTDPNMPSRWSSDRLSRLQAAIQDVGGEAGKLVIHEFDEIYAKYFKSRPACPRCGNTMSRVRFDRRDAMQTIGFPLSGERWVCRRCGYVVKLEDRV